MRYLGFLLGCVFMFIAEVFVWSRFFNKKINYKSFWPYFSVVLLSLLGSFNQIFVNGQFN